MDGSIKVERRIPWLATWSLSVGDSRVTVTYRGRTRSVPIDEVTVTASGPALLATVLIGMQGETIRLLLACSAAQSIIKGISSAQDAAKERRRDEVQQAASSALDEIAPEMLELWREVRQAKEAPRYIAYRERAALKARIDSARASIARFGEAVVHAEDAGIDVDRDTNAACSFLAQHLNDFDALVASRNERFVETERERWKDFFKICETTPMTSEQVTAILTEEDRTQLIAAAGSGKTSTVVAKVAYLLASGIAAPEEILCLAFNKAAAGELARRVVTRLSVLRDTDVVLPDGVRERLNALGKRKVTSKTFHSFGLGVVVRVEGGRPRFPPKKGARPFASALSRCLQDEAFARDWWQFHLVHQHEIPDEGAFKSPKEYEEYLKQIRLRKLQSEGILTLGATRPVRSLQEAAICNWLYLMGISFEYEADFAAGRKLRPRKHGWAVDFTYRAEIRGQYVDIVHEHFGVDAEGRAPQFFDDPAGYEQDMREKQAIMARVDDRHFWTTSAEWYDGSLLPRLETTLRGLGVPFAPRSREEVEARLASLDRKVDVHLIEDAVSHIRSNGWSEDEVKARVEASGNGMRAALFASLCWRLAEAVNAELKLRGWIDYPEMVRRSIGYLKREPDRIPYKRIIIDEFQDTAPGRARMAALLLAGRHLPRLMVVGDDWQAINRFAGSDLRYFSSFQRHFGLPPAASAKRYLTWTFRTNQGLADIAGRFVQTDISQEKKPVRAKDKSRRGVLDLRVFKEAADVQVTIDRVLEGWVARHPAGKPRVFILSRYGEEKTFGLGATVMEEIDAKWADRVDPPDGFGSMFATIHKSKGMQADYVLVLGLFASQCDIYAYPNDWHEDALGQLFLPPKEGLADAEDRRLLYVALTRAKHKAALVVHEKHPSRYAIELMKAWTGGEILLDGGPLELCGVCGERWKSMVYPRNGRTPFMGCPAYKQHPSGYALTR